VIKKDMRRKEKRNFFPWVEKSKGSYYSIRELAVEYFSANANNKQKLIQKRSIQYSS